MERNQAPLPGVLLWQDYLPEEPVSLPLLPGLVAEPMLLVLLELAEPEGKTLAVSSEGFVVLRRNNLQAALAVIRKAR